MMMPPVRLTAESYGPVGTLPKNFMAKRASEMDNVRVYVRIADNLHSYGINSHTPECIDPEPGMVLIFIRV